jgi:plasmid stabilization system protein ParE
MALKIVWTKRATRKFDEIFANLNIEWGDETSGKFASKVFEFIETLSEFPEIGSLENKSLKIRGFTIVKQVNLYYKIKGNTIIILMLFDNRQNPSKKNQITKNP